MSLRQMNRLPCDTLLCIDLLGIGLLPACNVITLHFQAQKSGGDYQRLPVVTAAFVHKRFIFLNPFASRLLVITSSM